LTTATSSPHGGAHDFVELPDGDKQRMARLYEEVQGRLKEMSLIVARNLGMEISDRTRVMMRPVDVRAESSASDEPTTASADGHVEVHCTETSPGHWECGCYDYDAGTCGPC
jgi:hypothetical protein